MSKEIKLKVGRTYRPRHQGDLVEIIKCCVQNHFDVNEYPDKIVMFEDKEDLANWICQNPYVRQVTIES